MNLILRPSNAVISTVLKSAAPGSRAAIGLGCLCIFKHARQGGIIEYAARRHGPWLQQSAAVALKSAEDCAALPCCSHPDCGTFFTTNISLAASVKGLARSSQ